MKLVGSALPLVFGSLLAGCGSRSGLDCLGESCVLRGEGGTVDEPGETPASGDEPAGGLPPALAPLPPSRPPPTGSADGVCSLDRVFDGSLEITREDELALLAGCEQVDGDLSIRLPSLEGLDALVSLRVVQGTLTLAFSGTLNGLENLEVVGALSLDQLDVPTLAPLARLREIGTGWNPEEEDSLLQIFQLAGARDLTGLGGVEFLTRLAIGDAGSLESLRGLSVPPVMEKVDVVNSPGLRDLSGLAGVEHIDELQLAEVGVQNLDGAQELRRVFRMTLSNLPNLTDMSQLGNLGSVRFLSMIGLPVPSLLGLEGLREVVDLSIQYSSLESADALASLEQLSSLLVVGNPNLLSLPEIRLSGLERVEVRDNALLGTGPSFPGILRVDSLMVSANPSLTSLTGFTELELALAIDITDNASLRELNLSRLGGVGRLNISCNAVLPEDRLEPLRGVSTTASIFGNQGSAEPCLATP